MGPSRPCIQDRPGTVPDLLTNQLLSLIQTLIQQQSSNQPQNQDYSLGEASLAEKRRFLVARERFELSSTGPKPAMLVHYTTGLTLGLTS
jgi:hypothetical protein